MTPSEAGLALYGRSVANMTLRWELGTGAALPTPETDHALQATGQPAPQNVTAVVPEAQAQNFTACQLVRRPAGHSWGNITGT